jgi:hypothetical protein
VASNGASFCPRILQFGSCAKISKCDHRHVFDDSDKPVNIPCDGLVKFDLIAVHNPSHYCIKVLEYLPQGAKRWISCEKKNAKVEAAMEELQLRMKEETLVIHVGVKSGDICAVFYPKQAKWCRAKVLETQ